jgi:hypothetical protein
MSDGSREWDARYSLPAGSRARAAARDREEKVISELRGLYAKAVNAPLLVEAAREVGI